ncbi:MAG TPA: hypothetical protein VGZ52_00490 [Acidimicrobiales bacterium]|jgi:class 3 adenylate cyclase|nr:hypothetical protein [Acidimicrobiales bacterium]
MERPSGTVTFLFTDIEGSSRPRDEDPGTDVGLVEQHDDILRELFDRHHGYVVATGGHGFGVAFARAADAVDAAREAQLILSTGDLPPVRMGLLTGEADERDGNYLGPAVNRATQLMSIAHGGQIVASATTRAVAERATFRDLGVYQLRDLATTEHVFQLVGKRLRDVRATRALAARYSRCSGRDRGLAVTCSSRSSRRRR